jgi:hypothetical protein
MSLLETAVREGIIHRINRLAPENEAAWGKMNAGQMLCHCTDQLRISLGELGTPEKEADFLSRTVLKFLVLNIISIPKNVPTSPQVDQMKDGTPPTDFETDRRTLLTYIEKFAATPDNFAWTPHFKFGALSQREWAKLAAKHLDHHLKQFGV